MIAHRLFFTLAFAATACAPTVAPANVTRVSVTPTVAPGSGAPADATRAEVAPRAHLEGGVLVTPSGERVAPPATYTWVAVDGDVALLAPPVDTPDYRCELRYVRSNAIRGYATTDNTAAGGSNVVCSGLAAGGAVVLFTNSRGTYAKNAHTGERLPCGVGAFARDLATCVTLDTSPFAYGDPAPKAEAVDFDVQLCETASGACKTLVKIPRGLNRTPSSPRSWDASYCSPSRVVVVADGRLSAFSIPEGRPLGAAPAPFATRVTCEGAEAKVSANGGQPTVLRVPGG